MPGNNATVEVDGPAADAIAKNILSSLGMDAERVEAADMALTVNGTGQTSIDIEADGPLAGVIIAQMVGGIEWDDHSATSISASLTESDEPAAPADDSDGDSDTGSGGGGSDTASIQPEVAPLAGKVDPQAVQFPECSPGRISKNTKLHAVAALLVEWYDTLDGEYVTSNELGDFAGDDLTVEQTQSGLSRLFRRKGLAIRHKSDGGRGLVYAYHPTQQLVEEVGRLGTPDMEAVGQSIKAASEFEE